MEIVRYYLKLKGLLLLSKAIESDYYYVERDGKRDDCAK